MKVAETIANQMGGVNKLSVMIGAHNFVAGDNLLQFKFKMNRKKNTVKIILTPADLYDMEFYKITKRGLNCKKVSEHSGLYWDMLKKVFEKETGLYLSL